MKKLTNWELSREIVVYGLSITRMIADIKLIKAEAAKLEMTDKLREIVTKVINQYDRQLDEIIDSKWMKFSSNGVNYFYKRFRKKALQDFNDRMKDDLEVLSEYQDELLKAMDSIHKAQTKESTIDGIIEIIFESGSINLSQIDNVGEVMEELENRDMNPYITADRDYIKLQKVI